MGLPGVVISPISGELWASILLLTYLNLKCGFSKGSNPWKHDHNLG